ncbi:hypothetical protein TARUN_5876 [Trichoderma arundinaceum]|uniref:Uncharacterized protein n=1 Tax=Trichoderma arundinaceum TaxID=490622 RepID=A0A395NKD2_TRIAR|nr:hypothetical protein TARUN_5876 [Trichoderma arundinaceum]
MPVAPGAALRYALSSDLPLPSKIHKDTCPRLSPRNCLLQITSIKGQLQATTLTTQTSPKLSAYTCYCTCAYPLLDQPPPLTRDAASSAVLNTKPLKLSQLFYNHTQPHNACPATFSPSSLPGSPTQPTSSSSAQMSAAALRKTLFRLQTDANLLG